MRCVSKGGAQVSFLSLKHLQPKLIRQSEGGEGNQVAEAYEPYATWANAGSAYFREQEGGRAKQWCSSIQSSCYVGGNVELDMCPSQWVSSRWIPASCLSMDFHAHLKQRAQPVITAWPWVLALAILPCAQNTLPKIELSSTTGLLRSC